MTTCADYCPHDVKRVGRWNAPVVEGVTLSRVTSVAGFPDDTSNLAKWGKRNVARALSLHGDLLEMTLAAGNDDAVLNKVIDDAEKRIGTEAAANRGTALHAAIAKWNLGEDQPAGLGPDSIASIDAYRRAIDGLGLRPVLVEQFVSLQQYGLKVGGTFDVVLEEVETGTRFVADVKTSARSWEATYPHKTAIQLAAYQLGRRYCPEVGWLPEHGADPDLGILISLPIGLGTCRLHTMDLKAGRLGLATALDVQAWRQTKGIVEAIEPAEVAAGR